MTKVETPWGRKWFWNFRAISWRTGRRTFQEKEKEQRFTEALF